MTKWEYRVVSFDMTDRWSQKKRDAELETMQTRLNQLGSEGWEMISYETVQMFGSISQKLKGVAYLLFFKRAQ